MAAINGPHKVTIGEREYDCDHVAKLKEKDGQGRLTGWYCFQLWVRPNMYHVYRARAYSLDGRDITLEEATRIA